MKFMKFKIVQPKQEEEKSESITKLELRYDNDDVDVIATDKDGVEKIIVSFLDSGKLFLHSNPFSDEFDRNKSGYIKIVK